MKKEEQVLVIENKASIHFSNGNYFHFVKNSLDSWADEVIPKAAFVDRWMAEVDNTILQLIPYVVIMSPDKKIFSYQRRGSEKRLIDRFSIGIGGHINPEDRRKGLGFKDNPYGIGWDTVKQAAVREVCEELDMDPAVVKANLKLCGIVYTPNDETADSSKPGPAVGEVHIGIVYVLSVENSEIKVKEEDSIIGYKFINKPSDIQKFEKWSQMVLQKADDIRQLAFY